ncbi:addiction module toxin RelE [Planococcus faecalis]|uniref:Addiction module toxin RelE n=1 Tax=Planococcus faecalis TaxID=1598147 RepID=A0ABN4XSP3_9BACL|nr:addiction module toxin RelE [Planococcus faecalis]AQU80848.1 addiction module toxin RelE [Planococcus faecalis]OHX55828.1 addiction module toxin RelE [Planococcus faecalis]
MYQLEWTQYSTEDYEQLDGSQKIFVHKALDRIKLRGVEAGQSLHGNLAQCNKLKTKKMGLRIILSEAEATIQIIQIVAIGKRDKEKIIKWLKSD